MDKNQFETLSKKLDAIIALLALKNLGETSKSDSTLFLHQLGIDNSTIATILDSTPGAVAVAISKAKKSKVEKSGGDKP